MPRKHETPSIGKAPVKGMVYNGDYNGTLGPIGKPPSEAMVRTLGRWVERGNIVDFNSSDNFPQGQPKFGRLVNGTRVGELGVCGYDFDQKLVVFSALSEAELAEVAYVIAQTDVALRSAAFLPRFDRGSNHGVTMYIDPREQDEATLVLQGKYPQIDSVTRNKDHFAKLLNRFQNQVGMITFQAYEKDRAELLAILGRLNLSQDTSGSTFVTPHGVDKARTLLTLLDEVYKRNPDETIIVGGDSPGTDGSLFGISNVRKIAVGDPSLIQKRVPGRIHSVKTPEGARRVFEHIIKATL